MKHLCCSKIVILFFLFFNFAYASLQDKSAILYYGEHISYPMVGIHDYIIVQPDNINTHTHGFDLYKDKIYAYVSIGEADKDTPQYKKIKETWVLTENKAWDSKVMDIKNPEYQDFLFKEVIEPKIAQGFKNFFFDTLDSYRLAQNSGKQIKENENALAVFINKFHEKYPNVKLIINRGFDIIDKVHNSIQAVLFESYYNGINTQNLAYETVSDSNREWLDDQIKKIKAYNLDIISVDYLPLNKMDQAEKLVEKIKRNGLIPYVSTRDLDIYGKSSKNAVKREILTLIDESDYDRTYLSSHQYGALPLEYMGYIQKLHDISKQGLPKLEEMTQYGGVVVWLSKNYTKPNELIQWVKDLKELGMKVVFVDNFGVDLTENILNPLGIKVSPIINSDPKENKIIFQDKMMGFEIKPANNINYYLKADDSKPLLTLKDGNGNHSTLAAITSWGGYAMENAFMLEINNDSLWVVNPFDFFKKALDLKPLPVPDTTTQNGNRILFSHVDGDGIMNDTEWNPSMFSGEALYEEIFKKYKIPQSVSIIGAEVEPDGLYPQFSKKTVEIAKKIYALENVEGASHTFSHPFIWKEIKNDDLAAKYRLDVKGYKFSVKRELSGTLDYINDTLMPKDKPQLLKARSIYWTGDCIPQEEFLDYVYRHNLLNINGGDTFITNSSPWQSLIAPIGLERGDYYQIYTAAQNENIYTNNWEGPFWGYKKVIQTFELTDSPRRFKPIDIYYHLFSGSKRASLNALKSVYEWALKQDTTPIFTSEYILKAMDYYTVSIAEDKDSWLFSGLKDLKTVRVDNKGYTADLKTSIGVLGFKHYGDHTYYHFDDSQTDLLKISTAKQNEVYLIDSNAVSVKREINKNQQILSFKGYVDLKIHLNLPKECKITSIPLQESKAVTNGEVYLTYKNTKEVSLNVFCK